MKRTERDTASVGGASFPDRGEVDNPRRRDLALALIGALGGATLLEACVSETGAATFERPGSTEFAATGTTLGWADSTVGTVTILPPPASSRTGDLGTKHNVNIGADIVIAKGALVAGDGGGGVFYWSSDSTTADDGGTIIVPQVSGWTRNGCWKRVYSGPLHVEWFGAACNNSTDDTLAIQTCIDAVGAPNAMRSGTIVFPNKKASVITATLVIDRKSIHIAGPGPGSTTGDGFALRWNGSTTDPMMQLTRCNATRISGLRFIGNSSHPPSSAIDMKMTSGDSPPNTALMFDHLWIGGWSGMDTAVGIGFTKGITTSGYNAQDDQSVISHVFIQDFDDVGIEIANSQNTLWRLEHVLINGGDYGIRVGSRWIEADNCMFSSLSEACIQIVGDGNCMLKNFGSEGCRRLLYSTSADGFRAESGYFQSLSSLMPADNAIINVSTSGFTLQLSKVSFTRAGSFSDGQEKIKIRGTQLVLQIDPSTGFADGLESEHFDFATVSSGDVRQVWWGGRNYYNRWVHGDTDTLGARTDMVGDVRLAALKAINGIDNAGVTRQLLRYNTTGPVLELGGTNVSMQCLNDLRGSTGVDISGFRNVGLNQATSNIQFNASGEHHIEVNGFKWVRFDDSGSKVGFYNATPVSQATRPGQVTDSTGGTPGSLVDAGTSYSQTNVNDNFATLADRVNKLETILHNLGLTT